MVVFTDGARKREGRVLLFMAAGRERAHDGAGQGEAVGREPMRPPERPPPEALCHSGVSIRTASLQARLVVPSSHSFVLHCPATL